MVRYCGVVHCKNTSLKYPTKRFFKIPRIKLHHGPGDEELTRRRQAAWIAALNRKPEDLTEKKLSFTEICDDHFVKGIRKPSLH